MSDSLRPHGPQHARPPCPSPSLLKLMSIESVVPSNHLILCRPLLLPPSIFPSSRVFLNESAFRIWWPEYWSFSFSVSPSNEYSGLISFRMNWLGLPYDPAIPLLDKSPKELKTDAQVCMYECSLQHYSQQPKDGKCPHALVSISKTQIIVFNIYKFSL